VTAYDVGEPGPRLAASLLAERSALDEVPLIDIGPFLNGDAHDRADVATRIGDACRHIGFFAITNHGVPQSLVRRAFRVCTEFFALPDVEKERIAIERSECHRGWFRVGGENLDPGKQADAGDFKEGIKIGQDLPTTHPYVVAGLDLHGPNLWPANPPSFVPTMREYHGVMTSLGRRLVQAFAIALEMPENFFDDFFDISMATAGPLHYPPQTGEITEAQLGAGAHTDYGALTMLAQDDTGGLQVRNASSVWIDVPPTPNAFVVNVGDMMARWTNDVFTSTVHRVINTSGRHRYSIPFFFDPSPDTEVRAIASCVTDERPPQFAPTTSLDHLMERINATFDYRATADSSSPSTP
jgi:isopenicillin N synthase-like dioxygenase